MNNVFAAVNRMSNKLMLLIGRGRIKTSKDDGPAQLHQIKLGQFETFDKQPRLAEYGFNSMPPAESDAILLFVGGSRSDGVIIATGNQTYRMRNLKSGEVSIADDLGQTVYLTKGGIIVKGAGLPMLLTDTPEITLDTPSVHATGNVTIDGNLHVKQNVLVDQNITATQDIADHTSKTMAGMRAVFNAHDHAVKNIAVGISTQTSNKPGQSQ